jgi:cytochrome c-type biogenesis protein CcmH
MKKNSTPAPDIDALKRQLAELDQLLAQGLLGSDASRAARDRVEATLIDAVLAARAPTAAPPPSRIRPSRAATLAIAAFVTLFGAAGYAWRGHPDGLGVAPAQPAAPARDETAHPTDDARIDAMLQHLADRLKTQPDDAEGWAMLARSWSARGQFDRALPAYQRVVELHPRDAQALADYADALASTRPTRLEGEPERLVKRSLEMDPDNVKALSLAGTLAFDHGDFAAAVQHWQRAVKASDPAADTTRELRSALAEARQRAGLPALPAEAVATAPAASSAPLATRQAGAITGRISLSAALAAGLSPTDTLFVFARAPAGSRMPLAILRKSARDLPLDFTLDDSLAMSPAARLSSATQVVVSARISKTGDAVPQAGDLQGDSNIVAPGARNVRVEIDTVHR